MSIDSIRALSDVLKVRHIHIESTIFRICCRLTALCLIVALVIISTTTFVSKPIFCDLPRGKVDKDLLNEHCYLHGTYRVVRWYYLVNTKEAIAARMNTTSDGVLEPWPGIRPMHPGGEQHEQNQTMTFIKTGRVDYTYFNWLWMMYFVMAIGFYLPNYFWKMLECGRMKTLIKKIDFFEKKDAGADALTNLSLFARYMDHSFGNYGSYMRRYFFCEVLAILNIILQMVLLNKVLHGRWYWYGAEVLALYWGNEYSNEVIKLDYNPMVMIFPKQTKCEYRRFGPSGNLDSMDALCMMPMNNFNDKFFLLFWFWCTTLALLFTLNTIYRSVQYSVNYFRYYSVKTMIAYELDTKDIFKEDLHRLINEIDLADWFVIYHMGANLDPLNFYEALAAIIKYRKEKRHLMVDFREQQLEQENAAVSKQVISEEV